jgi:hypothetical protein
MNDADRYLALFDDADSNQRVGEASGAYLTSPESADLIHNSIPHAHIIIMLRNPADRAYSLYRWMTREGYEYAPTFRQALAIEEERLGNAAFKHNNPEYYYNFLYFNSGLYSNQVQRFIDTFSPMRILFVLFDEFVHEPHQVMQRVFRFLDVNDTFKPTIEVHNEGKDVWSPRLQFSLRHRLGHALQRFLGSRIGGRTRDWLMRLNASQNPQSISQAIRRELLDLYEDDIRKTETLTGLPLSHEWLC